MVDRKLCSKAGRRGRWCARACVCRLERLWRDEVCAVGLADASMWRVILRFMRSRLAVACAVITLSVGLILFSVVSIASHRAHSVRSVRASTAAAQLHYYYYYYYYY